MKQSIEMDETLTFTISENGSCWSFFVLLSKLKKKSYFIYFSKRRRIKGPSRGVSIYISHWTLLLVHFMAHSSSHKPTLVSFCLCVLTSFFKRVESPKSLVKFCHHCRFLLLPLLRYCVCSHRSNLLKRHLKK